MPPPDRPRPLWRDVLVALAVVGTFAVGAVTILLGFLYFAYKVLG